MRFEPGCIEFNNGIIISYWEQLSQLWNFKEYNWITLQLFNIEFENDKAMQGLEFTLVLFCCGITVRIPTHPKKEHSIHKECRERLNDILNRNK